MENIGGFDSANSLPQPFQIDVTEDRNIVIETKQKDILHINFIYSDEIKELGSSFDTDICVTFAVECIMLAFDKYLHDKQILKQAHEFSSYKINNDIVRVTDILTINTDKGEINNTQIDQEAWNIEEETKPINIDIWAKNRIPKNMKPIEGPRIILHGPTFKERTMSQASSTSRISTSLLSTVRMNKLSPLEKDKSLLVTRRFKSNDLTKEDEFSRRIKQYNNSIDEKIKTLEDLELKEQQEFDELKNKIKGNNNYILDRNGQIILVNSLKNFKSSYLDLGVQMFDIDCDEILGKIINQNNNTNIPKNTPQFIPRENRNIIDSMSLSRGVKITNKPKSDKQFTNPSDEPEIQNKRKTIFRTSKSSVSTKDNVGDYKTNVQGKSNSNNLMNDKSKISMVDDPKHADNTQSTTNKINDKAFKAKLPKITVGDDPLNRTAPASVNQSKLSPPRLDHLTSTKPRQVHSSYKSNAPILPNVSPSIIHKPKRGGGSPMKIIERDIRGEMKHVVAFIDGSGRQHLSKSGSYILNSIDDIHKQSPINTISTSFSMTKTTFGEKYLEGIKE